MYKRFIREYPNFPIEGVNFKDISPLLADEQTFRSALVDMGGNFDDLLPDLWCGIDSRGYLFSSGLATYFGGGVICAKKEGKTPGKKVTETYDLEYGTATLELQTTSMKDQIVIVDDVLATGGTMMAVNKLAKKAGYEVIGNLVLVDLKYVPRVEGFNLDVKSVIQYD